MKRSSLYMLDTDSLIFLIRGLKSTCTNADHAHKAHLVRERIRKIQRAGGTVAVSAVTVSELEYGAEKARNPVREHRAVTKLLVPFELMDYDALDVPRHYGCIRADFEKKGVPIGAMDLLIAAHARAAGATLVTNNLKDFSRIDALACENWTLEEEK